MIIIFMGMQQKRRCDKFHMYRTIPLKTGHNKSRFHQNSAVGPDIFHMRFR